MHERRVAIKNIEQAQFDNQAICSNMNSMRAAGDEILPSKISAKIVEEQEKDEGDELDSTPAGRRLRWSMFALSAIMMWYVWV